MLHHRKKLNIFTPQLLIYYIQYKNRKLDWSKCQKQPLDVFYGKKVFFKMPQSSQETPVDFAKF